MIQGALVHLLGSRSGYTTLGHSAALPVVVRSALEHLDFGSLSREQDIASLESVPMALGQCVAGSWVVVSRVLPGGRDDVGRLTIEKVSIVVPLQVWRSNLQDVRTLVNDRALWNRARMTALVGGTINLETAPVRQAPLQSALAVVLDRWFKAVEASGCVVLRGQDELIFKLLQSVSPADCASLAWGIGLHGVPAFATICSILPAVSASSSRPLFEIQPGERDLRSKQASAIAACARSAGLLPPFASLRAPEPIVELQPQEVEPPFATHGSSGGLDFARPEPGRWVEAPSAEGRLGSRGWGIAALSAGALCLTVAIFWQPTPQDTSGTAGESNKQVVKPPEETIQPPPSTEPVNPAPTPVPSRPADPPKPAPGGDEVVPPRGDGESDGTQLGEGAGREKGAGDGDQGGPPADKGPDDDSKDNSQDGSAQQKADENNPPPCDCKKPPSSIVKPDVDNDKDGLSNAQESDFGSDFKKRDEDGDHLNDWFEWVCGTNPKDPDSDGDGLCDCVEFTESTSPIWRDTDRDGLGDAEERTKGCQAGTVSEEDGELLQAKRSGKPFAYRVVAGPLLAGDSRDSDGDGILDGCDISPTDPNAGSWIDKTRASADPNATLKTLFEALVKAIDDPAPDSKDPKKTDRQKFDGVLKAFEAAVGSHDFLQTLVPGARERREDWLAKIKPDQSIQTIFNSGGLRENVAFVVREARKGDLTTLEKKVCDAWEICRTELKNWAACQQYKPPKGTAAQTEPMPHVVESFSETTYVDPGWVAVKCGASQRELSQVVALVVLLEWQLGVDKPGGKPPRETIIYGSDRRSEHDKPGLDIFEREFDCLKHGPPPPRQPVVGSENEKESEGKK